MRNKSLESVGLVFGVIHSKGAVSNLNIIFYDDDDDDFTFSQ